MSKTGLDESDCFVAAAPVEKPGGGGSTRLRPLILTDGLLEIPPELSDLPTEIAGDVRAFGDELGV
jgi:hypothetical protein